MRESRPHTEKCVEVKVEVKRGSEAKVTERRGKHAGTVRAHTATSAGRISQLQVLPKKVQGLFSHLRLLVRSFPSYVT